MKKCTCTYMATLMGSVTQMVDPNCTKCNGVRLVKKVLKFFKDITMVALICLFMIASLLTMATLINHIQRAYEVHIFD